MGVPRRQVAVLCGDNSPHSRESGLSANCQFYYDQSKRTKLGNRAEKQERKGKLYLNSDMNRALLLYERARTRRNYVRLETTHFVIFLRKKNIVIYENTYVCLSPVVGLFCVSAKLWIYTLREQIRRYRSSCFNGAIVFSDSCCCRDELVSVTSLNMRICMKIGDVLTCCDAQQCRYPAFL